MGWRRLCRLPENFLCPVTIRAHHHRPDDAGGLVGECDRGNFGRLTRQQGADPLALAGRSIARMAQHRNRTGDQQAAEVSVAALPVRPKRSLPPLEFCRGVKRGQLADIDSDAFGRRHLPLVLARDWGHES